MKYIDMQKRLAEHIEQKRDLFQEQLDIDKLRKIRFNCGTCTKEELLIKKLNDDKKLDYWQRLMIFLSKREVQPTSFPSEYCFLCTKPTIKSQRHIFIADNESITRFYCSVHTNYQIYGSISYICHRCLMFCIMQQHKLKYFKEHSYIKEKTDKHETKHITIYKIGD